MVPFKIYNCDFGFKLNGVNYDFTDVNSVTVDDPEKNRLKRGANGANKIGIAYKEGTSEPKTWTVASLNLTAEMKTALDLAFDNQTRMEVYCIDRISGSSKMAKQAVLCNKPQQLTVDETPESMEVSLEFQTFDSSEVYKE